MYFSPQSVESRSTLCWLSTNPLTDGRSTVTDSRPIVSQQSANIFLPTVNRWSSNGLWWGWAWVNSWLTVDRLYDNEGDLGWWCWQEESQCTLAPCRSMGRSTVDRQSIDPSTDCWLIVGRQSTDSRLTFYHWQLTDGQPTVSGEDDDERNWRRKTQKQRRYQNQLLPPTQSRARQNPCLLARGKWVLVLGKQISLMSSFFQEPNTTMASWLQGWRSHQHHN